jgi:putative radical SAM enzyme (TIGR03279 family)
VKEGPGGFIAGVEPGSLGDEIDLEPGDRLVAINGHVLRDVIDVQFYGADEVLELLLERNGEPFAVELERDYDEALGLEFAHPTFDVDIRRCANNCAFCFVKQNAPGMRQSLYVKDDDYRYSFLFGNFVTLTNLTGDDWARLRRRFLGRKDTPDVLAQLRRLAALGIEVHAQVVLVPGLNDGEKFAQTVSDLTALYGEPVASVGVVPIGLTKHHRGQCRTYTAEESRAVLDQVEPWRVANRRLGCTFVYPSDEWYLVAGREIPSADEYDEFPQVENGVGMVRLLLDEGKTLTRLDQSAATLVCGTLIAPVLGRIVAEWNEQFSGNLRLVPVVNRFFGEVTTVSGLLTGQDVIAALQGRDLGEVVLLPRAMFTGSYGAGSTPPGYTLDDLSIGDIAAQLGVRVEMAGTLAEALAVLAEGGNRMPPYR